MESHLAIEPRCMEKSACPMSRPRGSSPLFEEWELKSPKLQEGAPGNPAKLWRTSRHLRGLPDHVGIMIGCRAIPVERMGKYTIFALFLTQSLWKEIRPPSTSRMALVLYPVDGAWIQLSNGYSNVLPSLLVEEQRPLEDWGSRPGH